MVPSGWRSTRPTRSPRWRRRGCRRSWRGRPQRRRESRPGTRSRPAQRGGLADHRRQAPQPIVTSSPWNSMRPRHPSILRTMPRYPRSLTIVLCSLPQDRDGQLLLVGEHQRLPTSSTSWGMMKMSAGPPQRRDVWNASGSLKRTSPRISQHAGLLLRPEPDHRSGSRASPGAPAPGPRSRRRRPPRGSGPITGPNDVEERLHRLGPVAHVSDIAAAAPPIPSARLRACTRGSAARPPDRCR